MLRATISNDAKQVLHQLEKLFYLLLYAPDKKGECCLINHFTVVCLVA